MLYICKKIKQTVMKYLGKKSLSSFLSKALKVIWYLLLVIFIVGVIIGTLFSVYTLAQKLQASDVVKPDFSIFDKDAEDINLDDIKTIPFGLKLFFLVYFSGVMVLMLKMIEKARELFKNFMNDIVFNKTNVTIISRISKLLIWFSVITFDLSSLVVSFLLLILCEIFKNGTFLQEEYDLTV